MCDGLSPVQSSNSPQLSPEASFVPLKWRACRSGRAPHPGSLDCSPLPATPVWISGGSHLLPAWKAAWHPALQLILELSTFCYQDLTAAEPIDFLRMGKICSLGTEFPMSSQALQSDRATVLLTFCCSMQATGKHGDAQPASGVDSEKSERGEERNKHVSNKPGGNKSVSCGPETHGNVWHFRVCCLWAGKTGVRRSSKPWGRASQLFWHEGRKAQQKEIWSFYKKDSSIMQLWIGRNPWGISITSMGLAYEPQAWAIYWIWMGSVSLNSVVSSLGFSLSLSHRL